MRTEHTGRMEDGSRLKVIVSAYFDSFISNYDKVEIMLFIAKKRSSTFKRVTINDINESENGHIIIDALSEFENKISVETAKAIFMLRADLATTKL